MRLRWLVIKWVFIIPTGVKILSYAKAVYDYAATATSQISLKAGDRVAVISKTGSDKGWWKGEHCTTHKVSNRRNAVLSQPGT